MPLPLYYWDRLGLKPKYKKILSEEYPSILRKLRSGDYRGAGLDLKKIKGHNLWSIRLNDTHRMLFALLRVNGNLVFTCVDFIPEHRYLRSKYFKKRAALKFFLENEEAFLEEALKAEAQRDQGEASEAYSFYENFTEEEFLKLSKELKEVLGEEESKEESKKKEEPLHFIPVESYNQRCVILDERQQKLETRETPIVLSGDAGSGKSMLILKTIANWLEKTSVTEAALETPLPALYLTSFSTELLKHMQEVLNENPKTALFSERVVFRTYDQLLVELDPFLLEESELVPVSKLPPLKKLTKTTKNCYFLVSPAETLWYYDVKTKERKEVTALEGQSLSSLFKALACDGKRITTKEDYARIAEYTEHRPEKRTKEFIGFDEFALWFKGYLQKDGEKKRNLHEAARSQGKNQTRVTPREPQRLLSLELQEPYNVYQELKRVAAVTNEEAYLKIGSKNSLFTNEEDRHWLYQVKKAWSLHVQGQGVLDLNFYKPPLPSEVPYGFIGFDEGQDLAPVQLEFVIKLAEKIKGAPLNLILGLDSKQIVDGIFSYRPFVFETLHKAVEPHRLSVSEHHLGNSYRIPPLLQEPLKRLELLRLETIGGSADQREQVGIKANVQRASLGAVFWYEELGAKELERLKPIQNSKSDFVVITLEAYLDEARRLFPNALVLTPQAAKGREWLVVIAYRLFDDEVLAPKANAKLKKIVAEKQRLGLPLFVEGEEKGPRRAAAGAADPLLSLIFNWNLTAWTRATECLIVVQKTTTHQLDTLCRLLKESVIPSQELTFDFALKDTSALNWREEVAKLLEAGQRSLAEAIWFSHVNTNKNDYLAFSAEEKRKRYLSLNPVEASAEVTFKAKVNEPLESAKLSSPEDKPLSKKHSKTSAQGSQGPGFFSPSVSQPNAQANIKNILSTPKASPLNPPGKKSPALKSTSIPLESTIAVKGVGLTPLITAGEEKAVKHSSSSASALTATSISTYLAKANSVEEALFELLSGSSENDAPLLQCFSEKRDLALYFSLEALLYPYKMKASLSFEESGTSSLLELLTTPFDQCKHEILKLMVSENPSLRRALCENLNILWRKQMFSRLTSSDPNHPTGPMMANLCYLITTEVGKDLLRAIVLEYNSLFPMDTLSGETPIATLEKYKRPFPSTLVQLRALKSLTPSIDNFLESLYQVLSKERFKVVALAKQKSISGLELRHALLLFHEVESFYHLAWSEEEKPTLSASSFLSNYAATNFLTAKESRHLKTLCLTLKTAKGFGLCDTAKLFQDEQKKCRDSLLLSCLFNFLWEKLNLEHQAINEWDKLLFKEKRPSIKIEGSTPGRIKLIREALAKADREAAAHWKTYIGDLSLLNDNPAPLLNKCFTALAKQEASTNAGTVFIFEQLKQELKVETMKDIEEASNYFLKLNIKSLDKYFDTLGVLAGLIRYAKEALFKGALEFRRTKKKEENATLDSRLASKSQSSIYSPKGLSFLAEANLARQSSGPSSTLASTLELPLEEGLLQDLEKAKDPCAYLFEQLCANQKSSLLSSILKKEARPISLITFEALCKKRKVLKPGPLGNIEPLSLLELLCTPFDEEKHLLLNKMLEDNDPNLILSHLVSSIIKWLKDTEKSKTSQFYKDSPLEDLCFLSTTSCGQKVLEKICGQIAIKAGITISVDELTSRCLHQKGKKSLSIYDAQKLKRLNSNYQRLIRSFYQSPSEPRSDLVKKALEADCTHLEIKSLLSIWYEVDFLFKMHWEAQIPSPPLPHSFITFIAKTFEPAFIPEELKYMGALKEISLRMENQLGLSEALDSLKEAGEQNHSLSVMTWLFYFIVKAVKPELEHREEAHEVPGTSMKP